MKIRSDPCAAVVRQPPGPILNEHIGSAARLDEEANTGGRHVASLERSEDAGRVQFKRAPPVEDIKAVARIVEFQQSLRQGMSKVYPISAW